MENIIDVTPLPRGFVAKCRSFYRTLRENLDTRQLRAAEAKTEALRQQTETAMNCFLASAATMHPLHRRQMERELLEALLDGLRQTQARFTR